MYGRLWRQVVLGSMLVLATVLAGAEEKPCAVVLLHGKWGAPQNLAFFGARLEPLCATKALEMPWARRRAYDAPYPAALASIAAQVRAFREQGYRQVLLAGHSFGANAALAYMAEVGDADGVIALAPGHSPAFMYERGIGREAVDTARQLVAAGKGDEMLSMEDLNQGQRQSLRMPAAVLLSYFDPEGLGHMPGTVRRFKRAVPLLWVVGTRDPLFRFGAAFAYDAAPAHPASRYVTVEAGHGDTPEVAAATVRAWVEAVLGGTGEAAPR